jgi:predicted HTH domain antitoxin
LGALVLQGYRTGTLSQYQASQLLGMSRFEFEGFLKDRAIFDNAYDIADLERDRQVLETLRAKGLLKR